MERPRIRYASCGSARVAWQECGDGPETLVMIPPLAQHIEMLWEQPAFTRPIRRLATSLHFVLYDKLGTGLSDPRSCPARLDDRLNELLAVLDDTNTRQSWLLGLSEGGIIALAAAHHFPERICGLVLSSTTSGAGGFDRASSYGSMPTRADFLEFFDEVVAHWGTAATRSLTHFAPTVRTVPAMQRWIPAYERSSASPAMIGTLVRSSLALDADPFVENICQPTLVIHQTGDLVLPVAMGRMLADRLPGSRYVEVEGNDHFAWFSPTVDDQLDEFFDFIGVPIPSSRASAAWDPWATLTGTERRVARLVQLGLRNREIAATLGISRRTVENHLSRCYAKLSLRSRTELALRDDVAR